MILTIFAAAIAGLIVWNLLSYGTLVLDKRRYYRTTRLREKAYRRHVKALYRENPAYFLNPHK